MSYADAIMAHHPRGFWKLNESSGSIAHDSSGNGLALSTDSPSQVSADPLWGAPAGPPGEQTADFNTGTVGFHGTASRVSRTWPGSSAPGFTAGLWINRDEDVYSPAMGHGFPEREHEFGWVLGVHASKPFALFKGLPDTPLWFGQFRYATADALPLDTWLLLSATFDYGTSQFKVYANGVLGGTSDVMTFDESDTELWVGNDGGGEGASPYSILKCTLTCSYAFYIDAVLTDEDHLHIAEGVGAIGVYLPPRALV